MCDIDPKCRCDWTGYMWETTVDEAQAEIARLQAEVERAEQHGYAKAMEAERILYDRSLNIVWNDAIEAAWLIAHRKRGEMDTPEAIRALKRPTGEEP